MLLLSYTVTFITGCGALRLHKKIYPESASVRMILEEVELQIQKNDETQPILGTPND